MSVVDGAEWEALKRYNLTELYRMARDGGAQEGGKGEEKQGEGEAKGEEAVASEQKAAAE